MWLEAVLSKADLGRALDAFCPLALQLGEGGHILLSDPRDMQLIPEVGLRATVTVELHWPVLGVRIPLAVRSATLDILPEILKDPCGDRLIFKLRVAELDVSLLPAVVDRGIVDRLNKELEAKHIELSWGFTRTLSHVFDLPESIVSARSIRLAAWWGGVKVTREAVVLAVSFSARVDPRGVRAESPVAAPPAPTDLVTGARARSGATPRARERHPSPSVLLLGGAALLVGMSLWAFALSQRVPRLLSERY